MEVVMDTQAVALIVSAGLLYATAPPPVAVVTALWLGIAALFGGWRK